MGVWDGYAQEILLAPLTRFGEPEVIKRQEFFEIQGLDYERFKLFFISVLWRADQSERQFSAHVNLGQRWRQLAQEAILEKEPGDPDHFAISLVRYPGVLAKKTISAPVRTRPFDLNHYRLSLGSYVAIIKVDQRSAKESLRHFVLRPDVPLTVGVFEFEGSGLFQDNVRLISRRLDTRI